MPLARRVVFYVFVVVYLVVCPLTILSTLGYLVNPGAQPRLIKTGLIVFSTAPPGASIYVENRRYAHHTPVTLEGLLPGEYHLKLLLRYHRPWTRTVRVEAEKASVFDHVLLIPTPLPHDELLPGVFKSLIPIPETRLIVLLRGSTVKEAVVYDTETAASWPLVPLDSPFRDDRILDETVVRGSSFVLFRTRSRDGQRFLGVTLGTSRIRALDLTRLFPDQSYGRRVEWNPHVPHQLFTFDRGVVNRIDVHAMALYPHLVDQARGFGVTPNGLYVLGNDLRIQRMDERGKSEDLSVLPLMTNRLLAEDAHAFRLLPFSQKLVFFWGEGGGLLVNEFPFSLVEQGVRGLEMDRQRERLLIWRNDRLGIIDWSVGWEEPLHPNALRSMSLQWVFKEGRRIEQAFWAYDGSHILFRDHDTITLLELGPSSEEAVLNPLLQVRPNSMIAYAEGLGTVYYLDRDTGRFCGLSLMPKPTGPTLFEHLEGQAQAPR